MSKILIGWAVESEISRTTIHGSISGRMPCDSSWKYCDCDKPI